MITTHKNWIIEQINEKRWEAREFIARYNNKYYTGIKMNNISLNLIITIMINLREPLEGWNGLPT